MSRWKLFNPNPRNQRVGDCPIRAITKALDSDWETVFAGVTVCACALSDMPSANHVWGAYLRQNGFKRYIVDDHGQDVYTVDDFCQDNPRNVHLSNYRACGVCAGWLLLGYMGQRAGDTNILLGKAITYGNIKLYYGCMRLAYYSWRSRSRNIQIVASGI